MQIGLYKQVTKHMRLGALNKKINFITMIEGPEKDEAGDTILIPHIFKTVWASVSSVLGREYVEAKKYQSEVTYKIITRYLKDNITPDMQIQYGERFFNIQDILDPYEAHEFLEIMCYEKVYKIV